MSDLLGVCWPGYSTNGDVRLCCPRVESTTRPASANVPSVGTNYRPINSFCGQRVVGEGPEWPFLAAIGRTLKGTFNLYCLGAFITDEWVLVDAPCVYKHPITEVIPGRILTEDQQLEKYQIRKTLISELTDDGQDSKGVALLQLQKPVVFNEYVQSICLPDAPSAGTPVLLLAVLLVEKSDALSTRREAFLKTVRGISGIDSTCDTSNGLPFSKKKDMIDICTTGHKACVISHTNALLLEDDANSGRLRLIGVGGTSNQPCIDPFNIYSSVASHLRWIHDQISSPFSSVAVLPLVDTRFVAEGQQCGLRVSGEGPEFPFMVALGRVQNNGFTTTCGGVIVTNSWILTEADCIVESFITHIKIAVNSDKERSVEVALRKRHESYDPITKQGNIGLLKLKSPLIFDDFVQPACLPSSTEIDHHTMMSISIQVQTSLGVTNFAHRVRLVHQVNKAECEASGSLSHPFNWDTICSSNAGVCDYGTRSVLLQRPPASSNLIVEGIGGSSNYPCIDSVQAYTRVSGYRQWIFDSI
ncbi:uncharacterized protein [Palaemon carinicauda]|uniref:uncharacterized protein isoform X2 n=1 Tax=Palaemon carinicauda TaxID=392227 RepID=UPI0035B5A9B7